MVCIWHDVIPLVGTVGKDSVYCWRCFKEWDAMPSLHDRVVDYWSRILMIFRR